MAKNLRVFQTLAEYNAEVEAQTLICPNVSYIKAPEQVKYLRSNPPLGIGIAALVDGVRQFYTPAQWDALSVKPTVIGVYVKSPDTGFIIHPTASASKAWSNNNTVAVQGVTTTVSSAVALLDFMGKENTDAVIAAVESGVIEDAPAFTWVREQAFADGATPFLPSAGQFELIRINGTEVNSVLELIGGTKINFGTMAWTSTQYSATTAWYWLGTFWSYLPKTNSRSCYALCEI